ncbi:hypothetical protein CEXT_554111 [Caerostris extrusa]|uniref:Uncharacterized protein n=1 Tax=Caerostris extrusa TaxID=172846 RepID=A0AAV4P7P0_CAEEX|nr:hypothetical protein CEXT_554111 [Caerostris extrusa]
MKWRLMLDILEDRWTNVFNCTYPAVEERPHSLKACWRSPGVNCYSKVIIRRRTVRWLVLTPAPVWADKIVCQHREG